MAETQKPSPKHGTTNEPTNIRSESQADGTAAEAPRGETQAQPNAKNAGNAPPGASPRVASQTPENREGRINASAPTQSTEGGQRADLGKRPQRDDSLIDSAGEIGGTDVHELEEQTVSSEAGKAEGEQLKKDEEAA
jgi:hypothetical protein